MCHVWPAGWIGPEITIIMCYVPSKLTILSKRSRPKENRKCQTKFEAAERIMMMQAVNLVRALKCFLLRWSLNTAVTQTCGTFLWFLVQCMVTTCFTPKMDTASSVICAQACFCKNQQGRGSLIHSPAEVLLRLNPILSCLLLRMS